MPRKRQRKRVLTEIPPVYKQRSLSYEQAVNEFPELTLEELKFIRRFGRNRTVDGLLRVMKSQLGSDYSKTLIIRVCEAFHIPAKGTRQYCRKQEQRRRAERLLKKRLHKLDLKKNFGEQLVKRIYT